MFWRSSTRTNTIAIIQSRQTIGGEVAYSIIPCRTPAESQFRIAHKGQALHKFLPAQAPRSCDCREITPAMLWRKLGGTVYPKATSQVIPASIIIVHPSQIGKQRIG